MFSSFGVLQVYKKVVVVGDSACGKTELLNRLITGKWEESDYQATVFETMEHEVRADRTRVELGLWDVSGADNMEFLRSQAYPDKHIVLVCYNIMDPESLENVTNKWIMEVRHNCPGVPFILVGLQKDGRKDREVLHALNKRGLKPVTSKEAESVAQEIGAVDFCECSAKSGKGVEELFRRTAMRTLLKE